MVSTDLIKKCRRGEFLSDTDLKDGIVFFQNMYDGTMLLGSAYGLFADDMKHQLNTLLRMYEERQKS